MVTVFRETNQRTASARSAVRLSACEHRRAGHPPLGVELDGSSRSVPQLPGRRLTRPMTWWEVRRLSTHGSVTIRNIPQHWDMTFMVSTGSLPISYMTCGWMLSCCPLGCPSPDESGSRQRFAPPSHPRFDLAPNLTLDKQTDRVFAISRPDRLADGNEGHTLGNV